MGFEKTIDEYREASKDVSGYPPEEIDFMRANALQKAWADRMCEVLGEDIDEEAREDAAVNTTLELGVWFREKILNEPKRKTYFLDLFDEDPEKAVVELATLFKSTLH